MCRWPKCDQGMIGPSPYCHLHREEARRNVLRALGLSARESLMWRDGDEEWLMPVASERSEVERRQLFERDGGK